MKKGKTTYSYRALAYRQRTDRRAPEFILFHAPAAEVVEWADVDRLGPSNPTGAQRPLRGLKVNKVAEFLREYDYNTIPTSIVVSIDRKAVAFNGGASRRGGRAGTVAITVGQEKPGLIIDGQHRVFGCAQFDPSLQVNVVAFLGGDDAERAFQFVVINNTATRINKDHIKALNLSYSEEELNDRLLKSSGTSVALREDKYADLQWIDLKGPFKGLLNLPTNAKGFIPSNAIETALSETRDKMGLLGIDPDLDRDVFLAIWESIREVKRDLWEAFDPKDKKTSSRLLHKVSIYALTVYLLNNMLAKHRSEDVLTDFTDKSKIRTLVQRFIKPIPDQFWRSEWKLKALDTSAGRQIVGQALEQVEANLRLKRDWYQDVPLFDADSFGKVTRKKASTKSARGSSKKVKAQAATRRRSK